MVRIDDNPIRSRNNDQSICFQLDDLEEKKVCDAVTATKKNLSASVTVQIDDPTLSLNLNLRTEQLLVDENIDEDRKIIVKFCWHHPEVRKNWKTVLAATMLFVCGGLLIALGCFAMASSEYLTQGVNFFLGGLLCFIPGAYHICYIWLAAKGCPGFEFQDLQVFA